jgi:rhamnose utilization protein RhaD (predicted bifunctional aldolase and dehydrogenase)
MGQMKNLLLVAPKEVIILLSALGLNYKIIQNSGGGVSVKEGGILWITASGTQMAQARSKTIFVPIDLKSVRLKTRLIEKLKLAEINNLRSKDV